MSEIHSNLPTVGGLSDDPQNTQRAKNNYYYTFTFGSSKQFIYSPSLFFNLLILTQNHPFLTHMLQAQIVLIIDAKYANRSSN